MKGLIDALVTGYAMNWIMQRQAKAVFQKEVEKQKKETFSQIVREANQKMNKR